MPPTVGDKPVVNTADAAVAAARNAWASIFDKANHPIYSKENTARFELFSHAERHLLSRAGRVVQSFEAEFTPLQCQVSELLKRRLMAARRDVGPINVGLELPTHLARRLTQVGYRFDGYLMYGWPEFLNLIKRCTTKN